MLEVVLPQVHLQAAEVVDLVNVLPIGVAVLGHTVLTNLFKQEFVKT